jgi:serine/threonine protein kinase
MQISTIKYIHRTGFAHCNIKPSNIAVGIDGNSIYFTSFGSSKPIVDNCMRQTDMISIAKLAIFMLHRSILGKKDRFDSFVNTSIFTSNRKLCLGLPVEFCHVLNYCHELQVHERPDYSLVRNHLRDFQFRSGFRADNFFDGKQAQPKITAKTGQ